MASQLERLSKRYRAHQDAREEFVFGADDRAGLFKRLIGGPGLRILDLGCRTGALTQHYATGNDVVGVDVDREALSRAEDRLGIKTVWADIEDELPFDDESFDVVVAGELLEHLADPDAAVANIRSVLRTHGRLVGSVPNAFRLKARIQFAFGRDPDEDPTHLQLFNPQKLRTLLEDFTDVRIGFAVGRYLRYHPALMGRVQVFTARKPSA